MDKTQKTIIALLILAMLFSGVSIFTSISILKVNIPKPDFTGEVVGEGSGSGVIGLVVKTNPGEGLG